MKLNKNSLIRPFGSVALVLGVSFAPPVSGEVIDRILVFVNSRVITQSALDARIEQTVREAPAPPTAEQMGELKKSVIEELVNEALLEDRARDLDLSTTDEEVEDQVKRLREQNAVRTEAEFEAALAASGLTLDKLREQLRRTATLQRVVGREVQSKVDLSDDALRLIYEREKDTWKVAERARVAELLVSYEVTDAASRATAEVKAREAWGKIRGGMKFEEAVTKYSDGPTKARGGDLGLVARNELRAEIDRVVFSLSVGYVSDPIQTKAGWHIVKVAERIPTTYKAFGEVKAEILKREQETQFQKKLTEYLDKLKSDALINVSTEASGYYSPPARPVKEAPAAPAASAEPVKKS